MPEKWFIARDGQGFGPFSKSQICRLNQNGLIADDTLVWEDGCDESLPVSEITTPTEPQNVEPLRSESEPIAEKPDGKRKASFVFISLATLTGTSLFTVGMWYFVSKTEFDTAKSELRDALVGVNSSSPEHVADAVNDSISDQAAPDAFDEQPPSTDSVGELESRHDDWEDLFESPLATGRDAIGMWSRSGDGVHVDPRHKSYSALRITDSNLPSFEFEVELEFEGYKKYPGVVVAIPVGDSRCQVSFWPPNWCQMRHVVVEDRPKSWGPLDNKGGSTISLDGDKIGSYSVPQKQLGFGSYPDGTDIKVGLNERCKLGVTVKQVDAQYRLYRVEVSFNGTKVFEWLGKDADLSEPPLDPDFWKGRTPKGIVIGGSYSTVIRFHSAKIRSF